MSSIELVKIQIYFLYSVSKVVVWWFPGGRLEGGVVWIRPMVTKIWRCGVVVRGRLQTWNRPVYLTWCRWVCRHCSIVRIIRVACVNFIFKTRCLQKWCSWKQYCFFFVVVTW